MSLLELWQWVQSEQFLRIVKEENRQKEICASSLLRKMETALYDIEAEVMRRRTGLDESSGANSKTVFGWLVRIEHRLRQRNLLESRFHPQVQFEVSGRREMRNIAGQPAARCLLSAYTLNNFPFLTDRVRVSGGTFELIG